MTPEDVFASLDPTILWEHFRKITAIPRQSGQESRIAEYIAHWAANCGFSLRRDTSGNICVYVPPSKDPPGPGTVALQAHLDMVCVRADTGVSDPAYGRIEVAREGEWITAPTSTLGADNGIGIAAAMCIAESDAAPHGPLELLFTVEEETTLKGADGLDPSLIHAKVMLNLDAEASDALLVGCAGATWTILRWPCPTDSLPGGWAAAEISLAGLRGGHSALHIHRNRLNAIKGITWAIRRLTGDIPSRLCAIEGGDAFNSIPSRARATIGFPAAERLKLEERLSAARSDLRTRFSHTEPDLTLAMTDVASKGTECWSDRDGEHLLDLLAIVPSGVLAMEQAASDLVETSNNLGLVALKEDAIEVHCLSRSSIADAMQEVVASIESAARLAGAGFAIVPPDLPPWRIDPSSAVLEALKAAYRSLFKQDPRLVTSHAATESGIIQQHFPDLEVVSIGPDIQGAHMVGERVSIPSVSDFYGLLSTVVQMLARSIP